ncbi:hypothetical protein [Parapedobacter sp. DT-150]|uniref:hypothetical protein n=1 Tax=Parapedobacter sp. DT-150 TaxID=3396162 RepID=UPI003F1DE923
MRWFSIVVGFLIFFNFPVPGVYSSAVGAFLLATGYYLLTDRDPLLYFRFHHVLRILTALVFLTLASAVPAMVHLTFDFHILKAFLLQLGLMGILVYCLPVLLGVPGRIGGAGFDAAASLVVSVFAVQSAVQILAFVFPPVADAVHFFQKAAVAGKDYGGIRALALSGNPFFDLSAGYALCFVVFIRRAVGGPGPAMRTTDILLLLLLVAGTAFAGRTGFIGLAVALVTLLVYRGSFAFKCLSLLKITLVGGLVALAGPLLLPADTRQSLFDDLLPFAFEFVYRYAGEGRLATESTDILSSMYFPLKATTFLFGDGRYLTSDGSYYRYTDVGYMRHILYYGVPGQLLLVGYQLLFFLKPALARVSSNDLLFWIALLALLFVLHGKGEVMGFMPIIQVILLVLGTGSLINKNDTKHDQYPAHR